MQVDIKVKKPVGLNCKEKRHFDTLCRRAVYLFQKMNGSPPDRLQWERAELSALEWALNITSEHYEHINVCDTEG